MSLAEKQKLLIEDLSVIEDAQERLAVVVDRARRLPPFPAAERTDAYRIRGCVTAVWLIGALREGRCTFRCDAEGPLVKGLVHLLCDCFDDGTPAEILASEIDPLEALGLTRQLSPTRRNGLTAVRHAIRAFAEHAA
jgi:cysteine desulfuration protein SufE